MKIDSHNYSGRYRAAGTETRYSAASRRAAQKKRRAAHIVTKAQVLQILLFGAMMVVIFFIGLLLPLRPEKSQIENRKLTPFPAITWDSFWDHLSGGIGAVLCRRIFAGSCMAYDRLSYQSIRSASGGCMAGRDHWRGKQCLKGFYIWLSRFGGAHRQPRSFSAIITSLIGIKLRR